MNSYVQHQLNFQNVMTIPISFFNMQSQLIVAIQRNCREYDHFCIIDETNGLKV